MSTPLRRSIIYHDATATETQELAAIRDALGRTDALVWVDLLDPSADDLSLLEQELQFHPLAIEDIIHAGQRAKVDEYGTYSLLVLFDLSLAESSEQVSLRELMLFVGANFLVSVHREPVHSVDELWERLAQEPQMIAPHPLSLLVYQLADSLVDDYFPIVDRFDDRLADLEEELFNGRSRGTLERLFAMRKSLIAMRRLINQMRDVFNLLLRRDQIIFHETSAPYYADVYDHLLRISDTLELQRDLLTGALESYLSIQSNELNLTVRKLTAVTLIVMVPTLIAGIYGMNFQHMPELEWLLGYPFALILMAASAVGIYLYLRRVGWI